MVSLGLILETGDGLDRDPIGAIELYTRAAEAGSTDAAINLAVALFEGTAVPQDVPRAIELLTRAADAGSPIATFNLGVLAQDRISGTPVEAVSLFRRAARSGEPRGFLAAAILLDEGRGVAQDPDGAADLLLRGVAADSGQTLTQLVEQTNSWTPGTIISVQRKLADAGYYDGPLNGYSSDAFAAALRTWRNGGFLSSVLGG